MINSNEEVVNRYRYTPYGESEVREENVYNPYQYTGRRYDEESGLYYYRARMYSPEQKRFTSSDPAGMMAGPNRYAYAGNNPTNSRDPSGMLPFRRNDAKIDGGGISGGYGIDKMGRTTEYKDGQINVLTENEIWQRERDEAILEYMKEDIEEEPILTDVFYDCLEENNLDLGGVTNILIACAIGCALAAAPTGELAWGPCVLGCLGGIAVYESGVIIECLDEPGAVDL